jgi:hypothetical protein
MQLGSQRNRLAWILVNAYQPEALEKEIQCCPKNGSTQNTELRGFIGLVNYHPNKWPHRAHILTPLTSQTGAPKKGQTQQKYIWTEEMQTEFDQMRALMAMDILCTYPNHNKPFHIYTDASDY